MHAMCHRYTCIAVRSHGRCINLEMRSTAACTPLSGASKLCTSEARFRTAGSASVAVIADASESGVSFSMGTCEVATPRSCKKKKRESESSVSFSKNK